MLAAWGNALITTRTTFPDVKFLAGSVDTEGYIEGLGSQARFKEITSLVQLNRTHIVISDRRNSCLRMLDRVTGQTSPYAGQCGVRGFADGPALDVIFDFPSDVMFDERDRQNLIILDDYNDAIRLLDTSTMTLKTLYANDVELTRPRYGVIDAYNSDVMYITIKRRIVKYSFSKNAVTHLTGSLPTPEEKRIVSDGHYTVARYGYFISGIAQINQQFLVVTDFWSDKVRVIDLHNEQVYSLCEDSVVQVLSVSPVDERHVCKTIKPHAVTVVNNTLYIGENGRILIKSSKLYSSAVIYHLSLAHISRVSIV